MAPMSLSYYFLAPNYTQHLATYHTFHSHFISGCCTGRTFALQKPKVSSDIITSTQHLAISWRFNSDFIFGYCRGRTSPKVGSNIIYRSIYLSIYLLSLRNCKLDVAIFSWLFWKYPHRFSIMCHSQRELTRGSVNDDFVHTQGVKVYVISSHQKNVASTSI